MNLYVETIKKIIYAKKEDKLLEYRCSLSSAKEYEEAGKIDEWIHTYLYAEGHNQAFSDMKYSIAIKKIIMVST